MNINLLNEYLNLIILDLLDKKSSSCYVISKKLKNKKIEVSDALIYLTLKRMKSEDLIISNWINIDKNNKMKNYIITQNGKEYLKIRMNDWINSRNLLDKVLGDI